MMVFFNDPVLQDDHVERAVRMAVAMRERFGDLSRRVARSAATSSASASASRPGYATLGRIGFEGRYDYGDGRQRR